MISDDKLIAWLCITEHQYACGANINIPVEVIAGLEARGWARQDKEPDWKGAHDLYITAAGQSLIDINGADYGVATIPEEA